jgi:integrase
MFRACSAMSDLSHRAVDPTLSSGQREYLTETEIERLTRAAKDNRNGHRDATMLLLAYRHGLRAAELVTLRWDNVDLV